MRRRKQHGPKEPKGDKLEFEGIVQEALPNAMFRVGADNGLDVLATISGRMRQYYIKILPGDRVTVEVPPTTRAAGASRIDISSGEVRRRSIKKELGHEGSTERQKNL